MKPEREGSATGAEREGRGVLRSDAEEYCCAEGSGARRLAPHVTPSRSACGLVFEEAKLERERAPCGLRTKLSLSLMGKKEEETMTTTTM